MKPNQPMNIPSILSEEQYSACRLCPRQCGVSRTARREEPAVRGALLKDDSPTGSDSATGSRLGYCRCSDRLLVARAALHQWEEPCLSGVSGSGAVFFSGCTLGCCFCQNYAISHERFGMEITVRRLADIFLQLQEQGACNIDLITATQYLPSVIKALDLVRDRLTIPVVYNCGGYERPEIVRALADYVDIWLPDLKYFDPSLAARYSQAGDYFTFASQAIPQMIAQAGPPVMGEDGLLRSGVIIRHLVLPGARADSIRLLHWMKDNLPEGKWLLSLMSQYTPAGEAAPSPHAVPGEGSATGSRRFPELARRITTFEYESVLNTAIDLGLTEGYMQHKSSAKEEYTPPFNLEGV